MHILKRLLCGDGSGETLVGAWHGSRIPPCALLLRGRPFHGTEIRQVGFWSILIRVHGFGSAKATLRPSVCSLWLSARKVLVPPARSVQDYRVLSPKVSCRNADEYAILHSSLRPPTSSKPCWGSVLGRAGRDSALSC